MKTVCVFCGSSTGNNNIYHQKARDVGELLAKKNLALVYGGGNIGLMGILADSVLANNGKVFGVIPHFLAEKEVGHQNLTKMYFVESMHERKQMMADLSDAFIAMPGGFGTLEELAEIITWAQLGLVKKPIGLLNVNGFFQGLVTQLDKMVDEGFLKDENRNLLINNSDPEKLLSDLINYVPKAVPKYIKKEQT